ANPRRRPCLDPTADFLSTAPEFRDEYPSEQADRDAEASLGPSAVNRSWRPTPGSAVRPRVLFGFGLLLGLAFAWRLGANALPLGSNEPGSKEARCLNRCRSALAPS
ncbi:hypothetical protein EOA35_07190, partial [Mesorhizobium sp. M8A.F.Ca.ET.023.01.1.1]